jgi:hypothetical protein
MGTKTSTLTDDWVTEERCRKLAFQIVSATPLLRKQKHYDGPHMSDRGQKGNLHLIGKSFRKEPRERQRRKWAENKMETG